MKASFILPLLLLGIADHALMVMAQSPGTFVATGNMTTPRTSHTATLLPDGKVLIAGGYSNSFDISSRVATAELYDPATGTFTATGNMLTVRNRHTATLLPDGKVLIASGVGNNGYLASAELYDPSTGTFTATGGITAARYGHTATLLPNGKILIAGGFGYGYLASAELYDPSTGTFAAAGTMTAARAFHTATLLPSGKVLIDGGQAGDDEPVASTELYDPIAGTFNLTSRDGYPSMVSATATLLTSGKVLLSLGYPANHSDRAELYDTLAGTFVATGDMTKLWWVHTATLLPDETVLMVGVNEGFGLTTHAELYDPMAGTFSPTAGVTARRQNHTATLLPDGKVLIAGGENISNLTAAMTVNSAELYNPLWLAPAPVLLSFSDNGQRQGAILHAGTSQIASPGNPAIVGEALEIYCTGLIDGSVVPPQVAIGGRMAEILFFGKAPGFAGLNQVNVRVPSGVAPGPAIPVRLTYIGRPSNEVTIAVR